MRGDCLVLDLAVGARMHLELVVSSSSDSFNNDESYLAETFADKTIEIRVKNALGNDYVNQLNLGCSVSNRKEKRIAKPYLFALLQMNL
jgi:hypothetical protein